MKKDRLPGIDFTRILCAIGIVMFHFACHSNCNLKIVYTTQNGSYGSIFVATFFAISGCTLYYCHSNIDDLRGFFYRRWKSIFPTFYLVYLYYFFETATKTGTVFKDISPLYFILTVLGVDGYFQYLNNNYYLVGEWFLGAIIILYCLYPLLLKIIKRAGWVMAFLVLVIPWFFAMKTSVFNIHPYRNIFSCLICFYIGMLLGKNSSFIYQRISFFISIVVFGLLRFIPLSPHGGVGVIITQVQGIALFVILTKIGQQFDVFFKPDYVIKEMSNLTFPMFLVQHQMVYSVLSISNSNEIKIMLIELAFSIILTIIFACIVSIVVKKLFTSERYRRFERIILRQG